MTMTDPISDLLTRIRNGQMVRKPSIVCPSSTLKIAILKVLQQEGFIRGFEVSENEVGKQLEIALKYFDGKPVIKEISRVSKPGMRVYSSVKTMPTFKNNMGITILSTSKGVMTNFAAQDANLGGEILCRVY
tara:strand:+ start:1432 stop:1827 length:396 start_codon:yes stop_codon:yes gene_type:complete